MLHSLVRWAIVFVGLFALAKFLVGWARKSEFTKNDRRLSAGFSGLMDLQVTLGLIFFIWNGMAVGFPMFRIEHMVIMLLAAVTAHLPSFMKKAENKYAVAFFAASKLDRPVCGCSNVQQFIDRWRIDVMANKFSDGTGMSINVTPEQLTNRLGSTYGALYAWKRINQNGVKVDK